MNKETWKWAKATLTVHKVTSLRLSLPWAVGDAAHQWEAAKGRVLVKEQSLWTHIWSIVRGFSWVKGLNSVLLLLHYYMHELDKSHSAALSYSYSCVCRGNGPHRETQGALSFAFCKWKRSHPPCFHIILQFLTLHQCLTFFSGCHLSGPFIQFKSLLLYFSRL